MSKSENFSEKGMVTMKNQWGIAAFCLWIALGAGNAIAQTSSPTNANKAAPIGDPRKDGIDVVQGRLFRKALRSELSMDFGLIVDNQFLNYQLIQPRFTFHIRESFGLELSYGKAFHQERAVLDALADVDCDSNGDGVADANCSIVLDPPSDPIKNMYFANLVFSPIYGKFAIFSKKIYHFDVYLLAGGGMFDNERSQRFGFNVGAGTKIFMNDWLAVRLDFRNMTVREGAPFNQIVNNRIYSLGLSAFVPTASRKN